MSNDNNFDALLPAEMAKKAEAIGVKKAMMPAMKMFMLAVLAGAFISLGSIFATTVAAGSFSIVTAEGIALTASMPFGIIRLLTGLVFSLGLILVVVGGAELFTGNNLIVMAWASGKISLASVLRNWGIVYLGNFVGAVGTAILMFVAKQYTFGGGAVGVTALSIAAAKVGFVFWQALALGILCNALVCLAVWLSFSGRTTSDKILAIIFPITAFVAAGFEHSVANMYFIAYALMIKVFDPVFVALVGATVPTLGALTMKSFLIGNLLPVTIGNVIGGVVLVAIVYWFVFLRNPEDKK